MTQHDNRRIAMQGVYLSNQDLTLSSDEVIQKLVASLQLKQLSPYSKQIIEGVVNNKKALQQALQKHLKKGWRLDRMNQVTVAIMEVALYEIENSDAISAQAAINEALNLEDEFDDPKSKAFVNGVLANFIQD